MKDNSDREELLKQMENKDRMLLAINSGSFDDQFRDSDFRTEC
jgi:hypothetical protein